MLNVPLLCSRLSISPQIKTKQSLTASEERRTSSLTPSEERFHEADASSAASNWIGSPKPRSLVDTETTSETDPCATANVLPIWIVEDRADDNGLPMES